MDFSQYLQEYMNFAKLKGMAPTQRQGTQILGPYFQQAGARELAGRKMDTQEKQFAQSLAWDKESLAKRLGEERYRTDQMIGAAGTGDRN
ncbi:MAG: hypothetical protein WC637_00335, partial [Victivallales bacterium]